MQCKADEEDIDIRIEAPSGLPQVEADRDKFKQVVLNLLSNAIKYNRTNGVVTMVAAVGEGEWKLTIEDNGMGIPEKSLPHLFKKFYRVGGSENKTAGTGLGLSICKQIVSGHGGRIEVSSKLGTGTTFTIHIPTQIS